jgi:hypothetical protein
MTAIAVLYSVLSSTHRQFGVCDIAVRLSLTRGDLFAHMCQCNASCFAQSKQLRPQYTLEYDLMTVLSLSGTVAANSREPVLRPHGRRYAFQRSYLVDSASSHMLVSKIKPCMSKYMPY